MVAVILLAAPFSTVQAASTTTVKLTSLMLQVSEPVTVYGATAGTITTLDPQIMEDSSSVNAIENLFLGLTDIDPKTSQIRAEAATKWDKSADGTVWTFTLRNDIPWVRWDPQAKKATQVRMVTAKDFEYGMKRSCDPRLGAYYTAVASDIIKGCGDVAKLPVDQIKDSDFDQIGVKALSDTQLEVTTRGPLGYFLYTSSMWMFRAVPKETIDEYGEQWTDPGNIVTDGPYLVDELDQNVNRVFVKNPYYPNVNNTYGGNVERLSTIIVKDPTTIYSLYQNNEVDSSGIPAAELTRIRQDPDLSKQFYQTIRPELWYFGFMYDKPPFDNVHVRRAFSAIIDRKAMVSEMLQGQGIPMAHFMPPSIRGAVPINEVGVGDPANLGFDPEYAKAEFAAAGYQTCDDFPNVTFLTDPGGSIFGEYLQNQVKTYLGCDIDKINIEEAEGTVLLKTIKPTTPIAQRPNLYTLGWIADYPDAHNWMHDVLSCNGPNNQKRVCNDTDKKIDAASDEIDPKKRDQMYREVEDEFFGKQGEFPLVPLYVPVEYGLVKPWYKGFFQTDGMFGGSHWDTLIIDQAAQLAARPRKQ